MQRNLFGNLTCAQTVLIAEDEYNNYMLLAEMIHKYDVKILYAENGQKAVDLIKNNNCY